MFQIINLTPHPIVIIRPGAEPLTYHAAAPSSIARAEEVPVQTYAHAPAHAVGIPVTYTSYARTSLPAAQEGVGYIVSIVVVMAALAEGRTLRDLYVPGQQVRDAQGRIVGCESLIWAEAVVELLCQSFARGPGQTQTVRLTRGEMMLIASDLDDGSGDPAAWAQDQVRREIAAKLTAVAGPVPDEIRAPVTIAW